MIHCSDIQSKRHVLKVQGALINNSEVQPDSFVHAMSKDIICIT